VGHAIDSLGEYKRFRHGEAISLGMMAAAYIAQRLWDLPEGLANAHRKALEAAGLPVRASLDVNEVVDALTQDKKYRRGVRFVLLREQGKPETDVQVPDEIVRGAIERLTS
jgi:3-dehydroquinate synthetase